MHNELSAAKKKAEHQLQTNIANQAKQVRYSTINLRVVEAFTNQKKRHYYLKTAWDSLSNHVQQNMEENHATVLQYIELKRKHIVRKNTLQTYFKNIKLFNLHAKVSRVKRAEKDALVDLKSTLQKNEAMKQVCRE